MRLLYVINGFDPGGAEHGLLTLVRNGFFEGHELHVLAFCRGRGELVGEFQRLLGNRLVIAHPHERLSLLACAKGAAALERLLKTLRPEAVVLSLKQANFIGRALLMRVPGIRCIAFEHIARYRSRHLQGAYGSLLKALSPRVDEIWADCSATLAETGKYFSNRDRRLEVVPLFAAAQYPVKTDYLLRGPLRCAAAGRLVARKRFDVLLDALALLQERGLKVRLDLFGDGPADSELRSRATALGIAESVRWYGYRRDWIINASEADVFLNLGDTEGFCIVVAEAMAAGLPVVARDVGGIRDYGRDGDNMLKLDPAAEPAAVAAAIEQLAQDERLRRVLGLQARQDMLRDFAPEALRQVGRRILGTPPPGAVAA